MKEMKPIWVEARLQCPSCDGEVKKQWYGKLSQGQEPYMIWVCQSPDCQHYDDNKHVIRPKVTMICPKCQQKTAHCAGHDIGMGNDFWDRYYLYCDTCGAMEFLTLSGGQKDSLSERSTDCPYCGLSIHQHDQPTSNLLMLFEQVGAVHNSGQDFSVFNKEETEDQGS